MFHTEQMTGATFEYSPPEAIKNRKGEPAKVDVYCWGMCLYQLITYKTCENIGEEQKLRETNHAMFLKNVSEIPIKGDENFRKEVITLLLKALSTDPRIRPSFADLKLMIRGSEAITINPKIEELQKLINSTIKERDEERKLNQDLKNENKKLKDQLHKKDLEINELNLLPGTKNSSSAVPKQNPIEPNPNVNSSLIKKLREEDDYIEPYRRRSLSI